MTLPSSLMQENFYALLRSQTILELRQTLAHGPQERDLKVLGWPEQVWEDAVVKILQEKMQTPQSGPYGPDIKPLGELLNGPRARVAAAVSASGDLMKRVSDISKRIYLMSETMTQLEEDILKYNQRVLDSLKGNMSLHKTAGLKLFKKYPSGIRQEIPLLFSGNLPVTLNFISRSPDELTEAGLYVMGNASCLIWPGYQLIFEVTE